ncbi:MAG: site-2 protease family protein [Planctomycetaceae bacterium]|nr:site-2 protease family protein [Planctomycetaceae bacterium]
MDLPESSPSEVSPSGLEPAREPVEIIIVDESAQKRRSSVPHEHFYELPPRYYLAAMLYLATFLSTFLAGAIMSNELLPSTGGWVGDQGKLLYWGFGYSLGIMGILTFHELGHYLQARRYGVPASLPYFIPLPVIQLFGTMGAVIVQRSGWRNRKILFDIAVTGPLAGLVLTVPILYFGLMSSSYLELPPNYEDLGIVRFGDPLILKLMAAQVLGEQPPNTEIELTPLLYAGWVGLFVTALNLIPLGQLDGGHILYALLGRRAHHVAMGLTLLTVALMIWFSRYTYVIMLILVVLMGVKHPPTGDDQISLGRMRIVVGWLTLAFLILGFTPTPIYF